MKYLWLKGCAGLGNRLITLASAIKYAQKTDRCIYVDWSDGMFGSLGHNVFYDFFEFCDLKNISDFSIIENMIKQKCTCYPRMLHDVDYNIPVYAERKQQGLFYAYFPMPSRFKIYKYIVSSFRLHQLGYLLGAPSFQSVDKTDMTWGKSFRQRNDGKNMPMGNSLSLSLKEDVVLYADFRPLTSMKDIFLHVKLRDSVLEKINKIADELQIRDAIGVHVRYTDKKPRKEFDNLIKRIQEENRNVFLCTDNDEVIDRLKSDLSNRVIVYPKYIPSVNDGGIHIWASQMNDGELKTKMFEDCVIEMWLLSMTSKLFWQGNSSFSYISKLLMQGKKETIDWTKL